MRSVQERLLFALNSIRCIPHILIFFFHKNKGVIIADVKHGLFEMGKDYKGLYGLIYLLSFCKQFRTLFYYRTRPYSAFLGFLCRPLPTLLILTRDIGPGLAIVHGFATGIGAKSIGKNCKIYQLVSIGGNKYGAPVIKDNVTIYPGAILFGKITIGNNVVIGANATVYRDVPDNSTVLPGSSNIMRWTDKS